MTTAVVDQTFRAGQTIWWTEIVPEDQHRKAQRIAGTLKSVNLKAGTGLLEYLNDARQPLAKLVALAECTHRELPPR